MLVAALFLAPPAALAQHEAEVRAIWVDSFNPGLRSPSEIDALVERVRGANLNTIVAQVRRNAQSLYAISPEGWVENYDPPAGFDPLQHLLVEAHAAGIEVHAWVNIGPLYSGHPLVATASWPCRVPCDPNHPFNRHGWDVSDEDSWLTRTHPSYTGGTHADFPGERSTAGLWFVDLGHPEAAEYHIDVLTRLLRTYDVDGIHLDYIRYPEMPVISPRPPGVGIPFAIGYNPTSVARFNALHGRTEGALPDPWDAEWSRWRRDQITAFVRRLYLEMNVIDPAAKLSAALITFYRGPNASEPRTFAETEAFYRVFQDWEGWLEEGILDLAMPMIYKAQHLGSTASQFREWAEFTKRARSGRQAVLGLGAYLNSIENTLAQIAEGRAPAATGERSDGFTLFSYNATNAAADGKPQRPRDELFRALSEHGAYTAEAPFPNPVPVPDMPWKSSPTRGNLLVRLLGSDGRAMDGALVTIRGPGNVELARQADGNGFVGAVDLEPGSWELVVDGHPPIPLPRPVVAGRTASLTVSLGRLLRGAGSRRRDTTGP